MVLLLEFDYDAMEFSAEEDEGSLWKRLVFLIYIRILFGFLLLITSACRGTGQP